MKIDYSTHNISFEALKYKELNNLRIPDNFKVNLTRDNNDVDCLVKSYIMNNQYYSVSLNDGRLREYGRCLFSFSNSNSLYLSTINNNTIDMKGVGSVLHLTEIISMLENQIKEINLYSLGRAIGFHAKFGFKSSIKKLAEIKTFLINEIAMKHAQDKRFTHIMSGVREWFSDTNSPDSIKIANGNLIIDEFIQAINDNKLKFGIDINISNSVKMELKREQVLNNKDYYNNLFNKYGIDYQIID